MRFGAVSSQLLALGSQLNYTPRCGKVHLLTFCVLQNRGRYTLVPGSQLNYSPYRRMRWVFLI